MMRMPLAPLPLSSPSLAACSHADAGVDTGKFLQQRSYNNNDDSDADEAGHLGSFTCRLQPQKAPASW